MVVCHVSQAVQDLCAHKFGERLYDKLRDQLQTHISNSVVRLSQHLEDPKAFLDAVYELWNNHCRQMVSQQLLRGGCAAGGDAVDVFAAAGDY